MMYYVELFFAGAFLCNCVPHLVSSLRGDAFPTPFSRPPAAGESTALVNFCWGLFNLLVGLGLLALAPPVVGWNPGYIVFFIGVGVTGIYLAYRFARVRHGARGL